MHVTKLRKVGGSLMLAIPPALLDQLALRERASVSVSLDGGRLVVQSVQVKAYTLDELMDRCDLDAPPDAEAIAWDREPSVGREHD